MNVSKPLWTIGSIILAQQAARVARKVEIGELLSYVGLQRQRAAAVRILPAIGLVALGAAVGAGVALLTAPQSGAKLRTMLSERAEELGDKIKQMREPETASAEMPRPAHL